MHCIVTLLFPVLLSAVHLSYPRDQLPDYLIIGRDTIMLKTFPLERLGFEIRPFTYGQYDFPDPTCYRGYQAVWKVVDHKLFLVDILKADASRQKADITHYFAMNDYEPVVIDGFVFADWFSEDLRPFPRYYGLWGCVFKSRIRKYATSIRFEDGMLRFNKYKSRPKVAVSF